MLSNNPIPPYRPCKKPFQFAGHFPFPACVRVRALACVSLCLSMCVYMCVRVCVSLCAPVCMSLCVSLYVCVCECVYVCTLAHVLNCMCAPLTYAGMYVCAYVERSSSVRA